MIPFEREVRMSVKPCLGLCLVVVFAASAWGQTAADISAKYPVVNAYEVRPGILMTTKYAGNGQVCEMVLEKRHKTVEKTDFGSTIPHELVRQLLDELVPTVDRGKTTKRYLRGDSESTISGNVEITESEYENVSIEILGSLSPGASGDMVVTIHWKKRTCAAPQATAAATKPSR
jgi:hypothetical protein